MKELNQSQMILLVLLITFVTSIATGIMTVSLLQQAPVEVTKNINQIVQKTIETVTPTAINPNSKDTTTVVVKEEDLIISSINTNVKSIVRINETDILGEKSLFGIGIVMNKDGVIVTDKKDIFTSHIYTAVFSDNTEQKIIPLGFDKKTSALFFKVNLPPKTKYEFSPVKVSNNILLGQTIIGLGGDKNNAVAVGRVTSILTKDSGVGTTTTKYISGVETDVSTKDLLSGSPFFNLSGDLVGIKLSQSYSGTFTPVSLISKEMNMVLAE